MAFRSGVTALLEGDLQSAVSIFSTLQSKFPDYFEIRNNLAVAHFYLGNAEKARNVLQAITTIPHNENLLQHNLQVLR